jgi:N-acetylglutamate synthase-like GNAT family acetyltransferase
VADIEIHYLADRPEYLPQLAQWLHDEWDHMYPGATLETRTTRLRNQMRRGVIPLTVVAHAEGRALGTASLIESDLEDRPDLTPWLASVFVGPEFRGRGVGGKLVRAIMDEAGRMDLAEFHLWTDKEAGFYKTLGWEAMFEREYKDKRITVMRHVFDRA